MLRAIAACGSIIGEGTDEVERGGWIGGWMITETEEELDVLWRGGDDAAELRVCVMLEGVVRPSNRLARSEEGSVEYGNVFTVEWDS